MSETQQSRTEHPLLARQEALFRVSQAICVYRNPKELFRVLAKELRQVVSFDFVAIYLYDPATNKIENPLLEVMQGPAFQIPPDFRAEETVTWWVYNHQEPVLISSPQTESRFPRMMNLYGDFGFQSACILPLTTAYRRLGSLAFAARHPNAYSPDEMRYLSLVADQVALAVDNALRDEEQRTGELFLEEGQRLSHTGSWMWNLVTGELKWSREHFFILGADQFLEIATWKNYEALLDCCDFIIASRPGFRLEALRLVIPPEKLGRTPSNDPHKIALRKSTVHLLTTVASHVSSTEVRHRLERHQTIHALVPARVEEYILGQALYR